MGLFSELRLLVFLRRISRELSRANHLKEFELSVSHPNEFKSFKQKGRIGSAPPKMSGASVANVGAWNKEWLDAHPPDEEEEF